MPHYPKIQGVADIDLPWNKVKNLDVDAIRDEELLAILLRNGYGQSNVLQLCSEILEKHPLEELAVMKFRDMAKLKGIGVTKACLLVSSFELARRALRMCVGIQPSVSTPKDVLPYIQDIKDAKKEHFLALFLNARNQLIHREDVSMGSLNASLVHPREVFQPAIGSSAASLILCHNHPSGDCTPSREDIDLTKRLAHAGEILGIEVIDHIVIASERFLSLKEGNLF